jgi:hypothetical protein
MAAIGLIGAAVQGVGAMRAQQQEAANYKSQQATQTRQAAVNQTTGAYRAQRKQEEVERVLGQQRAGYASSGVALSGSALDTIEDSATEGALDVAAIRWNAGAESDTQRTNARVSGMSAKNAESAAPIAFLTPVLGGVAKYGSEFNYGSKT